MALYMKPLTTALSKIAYYESGQPEACSQAFRDHYLRYWEDKAAEAFARIMEYEASLSNNRHSKRTRRLWRQKSPGPRGHKPGGKYVPHHKLGWVKPEVIEAWEAEQAQKALEGSQKGDK